MEHFLNGLLVDLQLKSCDRWGSPEDCSRPIRSRSPAQATPRVRVHSEPRVSILNRVATCQVTIGRRGSSLIDDRSSNDA